MLENVRIARVNFLLVACLFLAGCAPSLEQLKMKDADTSMPGNYPAAPPAQPGNQITKPSGSLSWKSFFEDESLASLIDSALKKNQELAIVEQEINVSKNEILAREGEYLPKVGIKGSAGIERAGKFTSQGKSDEATGVPADLPNLSLALVASWEVDVWKKLRNATQAALYQYLATIDGRNFMVTRLVAEIADAYYELKALHKRVEILGQNIDLQQQALEMVRLQKRAARTTELAVKRFEAEVLKNQSRLYILKQNIIEKENELNFLAGRFPQNVDLDPTDFNELVPKGIEAGIPSQLLENRPDVKKAELELKAAKLSVEVAKARFFPSLSIEAGAGYRAFNTQHFLATPDSLVYNLAANLTVPLLNRKAIKADYFSAGSKQLQAVYNFEKSLLKAYAEVANQLNRVENLKSTFTLKSQQVEALRSSIEISNILFRAARCDYMEVLLTRRDALEAQMELVEVKQQQLSAVVNLYQALGGGWKSE